MIFKSEDFLQHKKTWKHPGFHISIKKVKMLYLVEKALILINIIQARFLAALRLWQ